MTFGRGNRRKKELTPRLWQGDKKVSGRGKEKRNKEEKKRCRTKEKIEDSFLKFFTILRALFLAVKL